jgi:uncharacterized protein
VLQDPRFGVKLEMLIRVRGLPDRSASAFLNLVRRLAGATTRPGPPDARAREALAHYDRAIERLKAGDWSGFGAELDALRPLLETLGRPPDSR